MTTRLRTLLQKCIHWSDAALDKAPQQYFLTPEWKRAVKYALEAKEISGTVDSIELSDLERRILSRGYPVLSNRSLWEEPEYVAKPHVSRHSLYCDPVEELQKSLEKAEKDVHQLSQELQDFQFTAHDRQDLQRREHEQKLSDLQLRYNTLLELQEETAEDLKYTKKTLQTKISQLSEERNTTQTLQSQLDYFRQVSEKAVSLLDDAQREDLKQFLECHG